MSGVLGKHTVFYGNIVASLANMQLFNTIPVIHEGNGTGYYCARGIKLNNISFFFTACHISKRNNNSMVIIINKPAYDIFPVKVGGV